MNPEKTMVAVYGSLRRGMFNHRNFLNREPISTFRMKGARMFSLGSYPAAVKSNNPDDQITVEVYEVDNEELANLDRLEGHPKFYERQPVRAVAGDKFIGVVWCYFQNFPRADARHVPSGDWVEYISNKEQNYVREC